MKIKKILDYLKQTKDTVINIKKYFTLKYFRNEYQKLKDRLERERLLNDVTNPRDRVVFESLLKNYQIMQYSYAGAPYISNKGAVVTTAFVKNVLNYLSPLFDIVGVQPMSGPVSLCYALQYRTTSNGISLEIQTGNVSAQTSKMNTTWALEAMQDLQSLHGIDAKKEMENLLERTAADEICSSMIKHLFILAGTNPRHVNSNVLDDDFHKKLHIGLNRAGTNIAKNTRRGVSNIIVTTHQMVTYLQGIGFKGFNFKYEDNYDQSSPFLQRAGSFVNDEGKPIHKVFTSAVVPDNTMVVGYKGGSGECDTGLLFCPYVVLMQNGVAVDPTTFQPFISFMTRYGVYQTPNATSYYELVTIDDPAISSAVENSANP